MTNIHPDSLSRTSPQPGPALEERLPCAGLFSSSVTRIKAPRLSDWYPACVSPVMGGEGFSCTLPDSPEAVRASYYLDNVPKVRQAQNSLSEASPISSGNLLSETMEKRLERLAFGMKRNDDFSQWLRMESLRGHIYGTWGKVLDSSPFGLSPRDGDPFFYLRNAKGTESQRLYWADIQCGRQRYISSFGVPPSPPEDISRLLLSDLADKLEGCGRQIAFNEAGELISGYFCGQKKACPVCARKKAGKAASKLYDRVSHVMTLDPSLRLVMAVFTAPNGQDLVERSENILAGFRRLTRRSADSRRGDHSRHSEFGKVAGGIASVEVKRGKDSDLWHPHSHALLLTRGYLDQDKLSSEWEEMTGGKKVFLKEIPGALPDKSELPPDFLEVVKYSLKLGDLRFDDNVHAVFQLQGRRLVKPFGNLWGTDVEDEGDTRGHAPKYSFRWDLASGQYLPIGTPGTISNADGRAC